MWRWLFNLRWQKGLVQVIPVGAASANPSEYLCGDDTAMNILALALMPVKNVDALFYTSW